MKAAVTVDAFKAEVKETDMPIPGKGQVLIRVLTAGICGGDIRIYKGTFPYLNYPIINGHEFCGFVIGCGEGADANLEGKYVTVDPTIACNKCYPCRIGKPNCCTSLKLHGVHINGCFAEFIAVNENHVFPISEDIPPDIACLIEPYCIAKHALNRLRLKETETLLIFGAGPIGVAAADIAKYLGARVMVADLIEYRLEIAKKVNADEVVNSGLPEFGERAKAFTDGDGFAAVLEATGVPAVVELAANYVANGGRLCVAGVNDKPFTLSTMLFCNKEIDVIGTRNSNIEFPQVIEMFTKKVLHPEAMISHTFSLDEYPAAISTAVESIDTCKVIVKISE